MKTGTWKQDTNQYGRKYWIIEIDRVMPEMTRTTVRLLQKDGVERDVDVVVKYSRDGKSYASKVVIYRMNPTWCDGCNKVKRNFKLERSHRGWECANKENC